MTETAPEPAQTQCPPVRLEVQFTHPDAKMPFRDKPTDAGYDLYSVQEAILPPGRSTPVSTGIKIAAPPGWYYTIDGRSSIRQKGIEPNRPIIDSTYTGEVVVYLINYTDKEVVLVKGERIAQIILHRQHDALFEEVETFSPLYNQRGEKGFGSTGRM